jgi:UDP-N-acetylglucosamine 2-epimerase (non-hydrolysing)
MSEDTELLFVFGTRPEIIKCAPIIRECECQHLSFSIIHTGQHYDDNLNGVFFDRLNLPAPDKNLGVGSASQGEQTAAMLSALEQEIMDREPAAVIVQGDTNSVLAGALAASKLPPAVAHVEAGLRSYQDDMPEEINRVVTDHVSDLLFAPTEHAADILTSEGITEQQIYVTGNPIVDAVFENQGIAAETSTILSDLAFSPSSYAVVTVHRAANVESMANLRDILAGLESFAAETGQEIVYPIHPRARKALDRFGLTIPDSLRLIDPLDYLDFLRLQSEATVVFTDSGGVQEEACILGIPCVTLRETTERPETVSVGANVVVGTDPDAIAKEGVRAVESSNSWENPFGDGTSAEQIVSILQEVYT